MYFIQRICVQEPDVAPIVVEMSGDWVEYVDRGLVTQFKHFCQPVMIVWVFRVPLVS